MTADEALAEIQFKAPFPVNLVGPKGGDLSTNRAERRTSSFNGSMEKGLHKFIRTMDTTAVGLKDEQPWNRMAAYMLNAGRTNSEIAIAAGVGVAEVATLKAQRWFQELCATIANNDGEEILGALRAETIGSINTLAFLRDTSESDAVKASCARTLIEQAHGKPVQKIVSDVTSRRASTPKEEFEQLTTELANLRGN